MFDADGWARGACLFPRYFLQHVSGTLFAAHAGQCPVS